MYKIKHLLISFFALIIMYCFSISLQAQVLQKVESEGNPTLPQDYPPTYGIAHMVAGDLWQSGMPQNRGDKYSEAGTYKARGVQNMIRLGNFGNTWNTATGHYPIGFYYSPWWSQYMFAAVYDNDTTFCRDSVAGKPNPSYMSNAKMKSSDKYVSHVTMSYSPLMAGASDPARNYVTEAYFADGVQRNHLVFEAGYPTNVGLDVKVRMHQFAAPNWNNLNDFVIIEMSFKNTGNVDMNMDGVIEKTGHKIQALSLGYYAVPYFGVTTELSGGRGNILCTTPTRLGGYIGDNDPEGYPWDFDYIFCGTNTIPPTKWDNGIELTNVKGYTDLFYGSTWLSVKKGGLPSDVLQSTGSLPDKESMFGTPAIGKGKQRGWFATHTAMTNVNSYAANWPRDNWNMQASAYFANGGYDNDPNKLDFKPNPKFFDISKNDSTEDWGHWVPKSLTPTADQKPMGDRKYFSEVAGDAAFANRTENGMEDVGKPYPAGWGNHTKGFVNNYNFDGPMVSGPAPVSLEVGEEVTIVFMMNAGFRLEGIQKAVRAGRFAYDNNYVIPTPPALPDMKVYNTINSTMNLEWDDVAEKTANFAGYKIWKSSNFKKYEFLKDGMRLIDRYQEQMKLGEDKADFRKPINPRFNAFTDVTNSTGKGQYPGYTWGTWELLKVIPKAEIAQYKNPNSGATSKYKYLFEDKGTVRGFTYWYYISSYAEGTFKGPGGETTTRIETHSTNRNGASGLWVGTYPTSIRNAYWPKDADGLKNIGAFVVCQAPLRSFDDLNSGKFKPMVRPNPYKRWALHDNFTNVYEHKLMFYNLPPKAKITILDVSGKIIDIINFESNDPAAGSMFWDMFSKDGNEVASGLYVYFVEWSGGTVSGKFSILR